MKAKKIILTIYVLASFGYWLWAVLVGDGPNAFQDSSCLFKNCLVEHFAIEPLVIGLVFGIPTVILILIWGKNKKEE